MLINLLTERAQTSVDSDMAKAELLARSAAELDPEHPSVKRIASVIAEKRRTEAVAAAISHARELQSTDVKAAAAAIDGALAEYPGDRRLLDYRSTLASQLKIRQAVAGGDSINERTKLYSPSSLADRSLGLDRTTGPNAETRAAVEDESVAQRGNDRPVLRDVPTPPIVPPPPKPPKKRGEGIEQVAKMIRSAFESAARYLSDIQKSPRRLGTFAALCLAILAVTLAVVIHALRTPGNSEVKPKIQPMLVDVIVTTHPANAQLRVDDTPYSERKLLLRNDEAHPVNVSLLGFKPLVTTRKTNDKWDFTLTPEPIRINVSTNAPSGEVFYDGRKIGDLNQGSFSNSSIVPDGGRHVLSSANSSGDLFHVAFQTVAGSRPAVEPLSLRELIVASSLGSQASVYNGATAKVIMPDGLASRPVDQNGTDIDLGNVNGNAGSPLPDVVLKIARANRSSSIAVPRGNAPALNIVFTASASTERNTKITKERSEPPPAAALPHFATVFIHNGTPNARVSLDQQPIGVLDANGALTYDKVPAGDHDVTFEKEGFSSLTTRQPFKADQTLVLPGNLKLSIAMGHVTIWVSVPNAKIEYSQAGKNDWHTTQLPAITLSPGSYDFAASAPDYQRLQKSVTVDLAKVAHLDFALLPQPSQIHRPPPVISLLQGSTLLKPDNGWYNSDTGLWVLVPLGTAKCTIIFLRPDRYTQRHRPKRLEWAVTLDDDSVQYTVDSQHLTRKAKISGNTQSSSTNVSPADNLVYSFVVTLEPHGVQIRNKAGSLLDDFRNDAKNWTRARIKVKGDAYFDVRP